MPKLEELFGVEWTKAQGFPAPILDSEAFREHNRKRLAELAKKHHRIQS